jgi:cytochrome c oxidase assembly factor CtaG
MIRILLVALIVFGMYFIGIRAIREMTGRDRWALTKLLTYSLACAILTFATLVTIVIIF